MRERIQKIKLNTVQIIALGFLGVILLGAVLLWMPFSNQTSIDFMDALFTSTSAVCVTGLVTIVPATQFTVIGKVILLILIQIGGLGIVACTIIFFLLTRRKITLKERIIIQEAYGLNTLSGMVRFVNRIIKGTFFAEGLGAFLFLFYFVPQYGVLKGIFYSVFHAVSAFCNAGIDILGSRSFMGVAKIPLVGLTTMTLIVISGLGFTVWRDVALNIKETLQKRMPLSRIWIRFQLQTKIVLTMTGSLLLIGAIGFFLLEYNNPETLGNLSLGQKILASGFQSVTTRTAGFAGVPQAELTAGSRLLGCILMFIGGSPGGTAGGVKTTTIAMVLLTSMCVIRGRKHTECFGKKLKSELVRTGITIVVITFLFWLGGIITITVLEPNVDFLNIMYEVTSAMATVGLSADLTPTLGRASQMVLIMMMYIGRIGPLTMALLFAGKIKGNALRELPEKGIMLG